MDWGRLPYHVDLYRENGSWKFRVNENLFNERGFTEHRWREPVHIGPAIGPERLTRKEAQRAVWEKLPLGQSKNGHAPQNTMTIAYFVEHMFVPEHVAIKGLSGRTHYRAILKHVLTPEEVQHVFKVDLYRSNLRLKAVPDWPYLSQVRLAEARPEHIEKLVMAAVARGYSAQTVTHMRNVVSAIFSHAKKGDYFTGENPAGQVTVPGMSRKEAHTLSLPQLKAVLELMRYPEREMTLFVVLTGMNIAEICGLQWKHVNLSSAEVELNGELIPPHSIAVRKHWYRGELNSVKIGRTRDQAISSLMEPVLVGLSRRARYNKPDDFVLVSEAGTPVNETNIASRRLKSIGQDLGMPWLSWHVFRRTRKDYLTRFGIQYESRLITMVNP
ncbi:MAG TPA: tyrosine-type recombinase/integrase [Terracidiphilus sp.]